MGEIKAGVSQSNLATPIYYSLSQNAPNPFNPSTQIEFHLPEAGEASLFIYNALGQKIHTLAGGMHEAGVHRINGDGKDAYGRPVSSGIYFYRFESTGLVQTRQMVLLK